MHRPAWQNGLIWLTIVLVGALAVIPPGVAVVVDHFRHGQCIRPAHDVSQGAVISRSDVSVARVVRFEAPRHPATMEETSGHIATADLKAATCIAAEAVAAPLPTVEIALAGVLIPPDVRIGQSVDLLFAPTEGQDSRDGTAIENIKITHVDSTMIVEVTKTQREAILKYLGRSRLIVRPHV